MPNFSTFTDEDELYRRYLIASGRDADADPTLGNGSSVGESDEVLRHKVERGRRAEAQLRDAGYDPDNLPERHFAEDWSADDEALWRRWREFNG